MKRLEAWDWPTSSFFKISLWSMFFTVRKAMDLSSYFYICVE